MKLTFLGAAGTVTGSCYWLQAGDKNILVDCGMFQGHDKEAELNFHEFPFNCKDIDYILLTHSHIDHSGRIPKISKDGFVGKIISTKATADLCRIMLPDSGHIQEMEIEWKNKKRARAGKALLEPLYTYEDALNCLQYFAPIPYYQELQLSENIKIKFSDAGHILGSSILELWITDNGEETKLVFTGDLGNKDIPILRDPNLIESADYLIIESTYGDRLHKENDTKVDKLMTVIKETIGKGGNVIIPSFAVGRTQEIIYEIHRYEDLYPEYVELLKKIPVYVDSPLAISATEVFRKNLDCFDEETREYIKNGENPLDFPGLVFAKTLDESKALNEDDRPMIIISASGMCEAGRIKHHLKHNLWRKENTVLFVGYQAVGTLGRKILEGAKKVKIFGEEISIQARIENIEGFSGHADQEGLINWVNGIKKKPKKIFIVHGEKESQKVFSDLLEEKFGISTIIPEQGDNYEITRTSVTENEAFEDIKTRFIRLQLLVQLENIQEDSEGLLKHLNKNALNERNDSEIILAQNKLDSLEKTLAEIKKILLT